MFFVIILSATLSQAAGPDQDVDAAINEEFKWLQEEAEAQFVTIATKTKMTAQEAPSIVTVITGEEIRNMGARNIMDVLRTVPGFDPVYMGIYPQHRLYVRGMGSVTNEKVKIMINGHSMQAFWGESLQHLEKLPATSVRKIEIIRGPGSSLYGTGAFLGIINLITKEGGDEPSRVSLECGSYDTIKPHTEFSYREDDFKTWFYADYYKTDGYDGSIESDMATITPGFVPSASREMNEASEHHTFHTNINYKGLHFSGFFQETDDKTPVGVSGALTDENYIESLYAYAELGWHLPIINRGNLHTRAYYDYAEGKMSLELFPEETAEVFGFPPGEGIHEEYQDEHSVSGIEITADYEAYSGIQIVGGTSYEHIKQFSMKKYANHNPSPNPLEIDGIIYDPFLFEYFPAGMTDISEKASIDDDRDRNVAAVYLQGTFDFGKLFSLERGMKNLSFTIGGRYDHYDDVGSSANPRLGIVYAPTDDLWFKALYATAFRAPSFLELYLRNHASLKGNKDLKPEKIATAEVLIGYRFTRNISGSLTCFDIRAEDLIQLSLSDSEVLVYKYENIGRTESLGVEAELKAAFGKHKYAYLNFTWQNVKDRTNKTVVSKDGQTYTQEDFHPGAAPEFYGNIGLNYGISKKIIADISLNYAGESKRSEEKIWVGETLMRKDQRKPVEECWLLNASLTFRDFFVKGTEIQISGFNLLDEDHRDPDLNGNIKNDLPRSGRSFTGRISYLF